MDKHKEINVNVAVRVRPLLSAQEKNVVNHVPEENVLIIQDKRNVFSFDEIFAADATQAEVYNKIMTPLHEKVLAGYNCTVFAYGQTGAGKSYTMGTDVAKHKTSANNAGIISRVLDDTFNEFKVDSDTAVAVSFIEIYNEKVYNLLSPNRKALVVKGFRVPGLSVQEVGTLERARHWLAYGSQNRHVGNTVQNSSSSRSHAIFTIHYTRAGAVSKLHLVDLAGSESVRRTGNKGTPFREGVTINKGLLAIRRVIEALGKESRSIPYRESTLTTILQDSLNLNNYVTFLACISPSSDDVHETLTTLRFAQTTKSVRSRPVLSSIADEFDRTHPGVLAPLDGYGTVRKPFRNTLITSTQHKNPKPSISNSIFNSLMEDAISPVASDSILDFKSTPDGNPPATDKMLQPLAKRLTMHILNHLKDLEISEPSLNGNQEEMKEKMLKLPWRDIVEQVTRSGDETGHSGNGTKPLEYRRQLHFDVENVAINNENAKDEDSGSLFKVPDAYPKKRASKRTSIVQTKTTIRRSTRLSELKDVEEVRQNTINASREVFYDISNTPKRMKTDESEVSSGKMNSEAKEALSYETPRPVNLRRSLRLSTKFQSPLKRQSVLKFPVRENGTWTTTDKNEMLNVHRKNVLDILNNGTKKQLETLAIIGAKTSTQIMQFRTLRGKFEKFEDLQKLPFWTGKNFTRFMESNLLI